MIASALSWIVRHPAEQIAAEQARLRAEGGGRREAAPDIPPIGRSPQPQPLLPPPTQAAAPEQPSGPDLRNISPRDFADLMHELYLGGVLDWQEYRMVGFPSQLHPRYDETIGALTGEKAAPDQPRDMLADWEARVDFERRHDGAPAEQRPRAERILEVLSWQGQTHVNVAA